MLMMLRIELRTLRVLGARDNHYITRSTVESRYNEPRL